MAALLSSTVTIGACGFSAPVFAQDALEDDSSDTSNIIIVTARKQNETLQETPVTVTSIGGDTLDKFQVNEVADVVSRIPALNVQVGGSGAGGQISLRGVGTTNISAAFDSAVAFDFDGVSMSTMRLVQASFFRRRADRCAQRPAIPVLREERLGRRLLRPLRQSDRRLGSRRQGLL